MAACMWLYVQLVLVPYQKNQGPMRQSPRGNLSDLYPRWLGARELLLRHRDPYGADITVENQIGYYGRPLDPSRPGDPKDEQGFAYPVYVVLLLAPTVKLSFATVHETFFWLLGILTATTIPLWARALGWRLSKSSIFTWIVLALSCFPAIQGLKLQQLSLLVGVFIAAAIAALVSRRFVLAGLLIGLATIKPQLVFLLVAFLAIWVLGNWRERQRALWSFAITIGVLVSAGEFLLPGWITEFRRAMQEYYRYTGGGLSVLDVMLSPTWGRITGALLVPMLLIFLWINRKSREDSRAFQWSFCLTLATTLLVIPMFAPYNQVLLLPALMMGVRAGRELRAKGRVSRFFCMIGAISVLWQFLAAACLVIALAFVPAVTVQKAWVLPLSLNFAIPITVYALLIAARDVLAEEGQASSA